MRVLFDGSAPVRVAWVNHEAESFFGPLKRYLVLRVQEQDIKLCVSDDDAKRVIDACSARHGDLRLRFVLEEV